MRIRSAFAMTTVLSVVAAFMLASLPGVASAESTWDRIKRTGELRQGVIDNPPYWYRDKKTGKFVGAMYEAAQDVAKVLGVKLIDQEDTWSTAVLNLQSGRIDMHFSLNATPKRALAIDFAGPIYRVGSYVVNHKDFKGKTWADYNKPEVKVAVTMGTADEGILDMMAPNTNKIQMQEMAEGIMAVVAGRAHAFTTTVMTALIMYNKNPGLGEFVFPTPRIMSKVYVGLRREDGTEKNDGAFRKFMDAWAEHAVDTGQQAARLKRHLKSLGINTIPDSVTF